MAMICRTGARECDGCGHCMEPGPGDIVGICRQCHEPVLVSDGRYEFPDGEIVHDDCAIEFIRAHYYCPGV